MASKRRLRRKGCEGKVQHASREDAQAHSNAMWRHAGGGTHIYHCKFGDHWHIGHPTSQQIQGMKARKRAKALGFG